MTVFVCLFAFSRAYLRNYMSDLHQIVKMHVTYVCGSVLLRRRCDRLCTSGFLDEVIFVHIVPYAGVPV